MEKTHLGTSNRLVLLLIAGVPLTMILGATWLWYFVVRGDLDLVGVLGTSNRGALVQPPRQIDDAVLTDASGASFRYANLKRRWSMVIPGVGGGCDTICEHNLYVTRQIHIGLGKESNRLQRFYISETGPGETRMVVQELSDNHPAPESFEALLAREHPGLQPLVLGPGGFDELFTEYLVEPGSWYLVDPSGWIMMSYNKDISYKDVIADLKFLLKNSGD